MSSLGFSPIHSANRVLQPNIAGGANPSGAHFVNPGPQFSSIVGGVTGCGGAGGSAAALAGNPGYNIEANQSGGRSHRRGGQKRGQSNKRCKCRGSCHCRKSKKRCTCRGKCHCRKSNERSCKCRGKCHCKRSNKRTMRGGLNAFSPASFSGAANLPYHQYMGGVPSSNNFSVGSSTPLPLNLIGTATPGPITVVPNCAPN